MSAPGVSNLGPRYNHGPARQPQHDSYGRKVPVWEALSLEVVPSAKDVVEKQAWWKSWTRRRPSSEPTGSNVKFGFGAQQHFRKQSSWKSWITKLNSFDSSKSKDEHPDSPYTSLPTRQGFERQSLWKPVTLQLHVLGSIFCITLLLIATLEYLSYHSTGSSNEDGGGLAFAATTDDLPAAPLFLYLYLPTIIAVFYSMIWSWVDLDTKRLEPWFQLSKPQGAIAEHSLLLQYPFDFLALVPIRAARRRHWAVVIAGSTMVFITWAIVPLQSAIFTTGTVRRVRDCPMVPTSEFLSPTAQTAVLDSHILNTAYGVSWLGQTLPPYTTKDYALLPFKPKEADSTISTSETWSATTQMYYTNLTCEAANVTEGTTREFNSWTFDDGNGCLLPDIALPGPLADSISRNLVQYFPYWNDANVDYALENPNCTKEKNKHKFMALWGEPTVEMDSTGRDQSYYSNLTVLFCQPSYHVREVTATVNASTFAVVDVSFNSSIPAIPFTEETFNITNFEYLIGTGVIPTSFEQVGNVQDTTRVQQYPRLMNYSVNYPVSNMVGYGIATSLVEPAKLSDPANLHAAFDAAHKLLFAIAVNELMAPINETNLLKPSLAAAVANGRRQDQPGAVVLVRTFSIIVEACLAAVALLTITLWLYYRKRDSQMVSDPGSISDIMQLVRRSQKLLHDFKDNGRVTTEVLNDRLQGHRFRLVASRSRGLPLMQLEAMNDKTQHQQADFGLKESETGFSEIDCPEQFQAVRPFELTYYTGVMITAVVSAAVVILVMFYDRISKENGLQKPTENAIVLTILINLIPTAFATLIEPFWVVLNRLLCILQPFDDLRTGNAKPTSTVDARYTAVPPQLALWRALRSGHFLLATVCAMALSTNILAVALSGVFNESPATVILNTITTASFEPTLDGVPDILQNTFAGISLTYLDHYYAAIANFTGAASLPPWVDDSFFYLPFDLSLAAFDATPEKDHRLTGYSGSTRGFGVHVDCKELHDLEDDQGDSIVFEPTTNGSNIQVAVQHRKPNGTLINCGGFNFGNETFRNTNVAPEGASSIEFISNLAIKAGQPIVPEYDDGFCAMTMLVGYARVSSAVDNSTISLAEARNKTQGRAFEHSWLMCTPKLQTAMFDVNVDTGGRIISSNRTTDFAKDLEPFGSDEAIFRLLAQVNRLITPGTPKHGRWHNDTFAPDWLSATLAIKLNSTHLVDPAAPVPNMNELAPNFAAVYNQLAALILNFDRKLFKIPEQDLIMNVGLITTQERIFMEPLMFYLAVALLGLQLLTLVAYYVFRPRRFLPRMPLTIASVIAFVSASHAVQEFERVKPKGDVRYGYGRFRGVDGRTHVGIEREPLVIPLKSRNPAAKKRRFRLWRRESYPAEPPTWI